MPVMYSGERCFLWFMLNVAMFNRLEYIRKSDCAENVCARYDCKAGFWGVEGGPCLGILPVSDA